MKTYGNLMTVICIVFWLAMALQPVQAFDLAEKMPVGGMMQCGDINKEVAEWKVGKQHA